jgi:transposase-like protein
MAAHPDQEERQQGNRRNGKTNKVVKSAAGKFPLSTPRGRVGSFESQIVLKRQVIIAEELEEKVISLYEMGMSFPSRSTNV